MKNRNKRNLTFLMKSEFIFNFSNSFAIFMIIITEILLISYFLTENFHRKRFSGTKEITTAKVISKNSKTEFLNSKTYYEYSYKYTINDRIFKNSNR